MQLHDNVELYLWWLKDILMKLGVNIRERIARL